MVGKVVVKLAKLSEVGQNIIFRSKMNLRKVLKTKSED